MIHCLAFSSKLLGTFFDNIIDVAIKLINRINKYFVYARLFSELSENNEEEYSRLLYFNVVRWLSKGGMLKRFYLLRYPVLQCLKKILNIKIRIKFK